MFASSARCLRLQLDVCVFILGGGNVSRVSRACTSCTRARASERASERAVCVCVCVHASERARERRARERRARESARAHRHKHGTSGEKTSDVVPTDYGYFYFEF